MQGLAHGRWTVNVNSLIRTDYLIIMPLRPSGPGRDLGRPHSAGDEHWRSDAGGCGRPAEGCPLAELQPARLPSPWRCEGLTGAGADPYLLPSVTRLCGCRSRQRGAHPEGQQQAEGQPLNNKVLTGRTPGSSETKGKPGQQDSGDGNAGDETSLGQSVGSFFGPWGAIVLGEGF